MGVEEKKLHIRMFGGFSANYGDEALTFGQRKAPKFGQLFQILMTRPGKGFNKDDIAKILYGYEQVEDMNASLNNTIFRLCTYLKESPLPAGEYLILRDGGLRFAGEVEVESDAWSFECAGREFEAELDGRKKAEISKKACELYRGEFLPQLSSEQWVIEKSKEYEKLYAQMLNYLLHYLSEEGDFAGIESLAARAAEIYPFEGWEHWQIESLIARGRHQEADRVYRAAVDRMQKAGDFLSKDRRTDLQKTAMKIRYPEGSEADIRKCLAEPEPAEGAYRCTIPGFLDCYRMLKRASARRETVCFSLFLCTVLGADGQPARDGKCCKKMEERLRETFRWCLRRGDVYAKYSENQYLLLCAGAEEGNLLQIGTRVAVDLRKRCGGRGDVRCRLLDSGGWREKPHSRQMWPPY